MYTDYILRADTEDALAAALPSLRAGDKWVDRDDGLHVFRALGPRRLTAPVVDTSGDDPVVVEPSTYDERFHAALRLHADHPDRDAIVAAIEAFVIPHDQITEAPFLPW